jgi:predicted nucleic acid-binding protein
MNAAYLDSSFFVAVLFGERNAPALRRILGSFETVFISDLVVTETLAALVREEIDPGDAASAVASMSLVLPDRSLASEVESVLEHGYLRGADAWHLACALFLTGDARSELAFLSRDESQRRVAKRLGFRVP